jgi:hypothetical protein
MQLATAFRASRAVYVATELGIPDLLAGRSMSSSELAAATKTHRVSVHRLMRALSALGVFDEREPDRFSLAPMGRLLRRDVPGSLRAPVLFLAGETGWRVWGDLLFSIQTGDAALEHVLGMQTFDYWASHPEEGAIHDEAMAAWSALVAASILAAYDFSTFRVVVDVGGGTGLLLAEILAAHSHLRGILVDLAHVVAAAPKILEPKGVASRCQIEGGSFFESIPTGGDAYLLKAIIHDWDDSRATAILTGCRKAMTPSSTLLVVDHVLPRRAEEGQSMPGFLTDLEMLVRTPGGRERTEEEFRSLFAGAGFELKRVISTASPLSVVEGRPRP